MTGTSMNSKTISQYRKVHGKPHNCGGYDQDYPDRDIWFYDDVKCDVIKVLDALEKAQEINER